MEIERPTVSWLNWEIGLCAERLQKDPAACETEFNDCFAGMADNGIEGRKGVLESVLKQCIKDGWQDIRTIRKDLPLNSIADLEKIVRIISATARAPKSKPPNCSTALDKSGVKGERRVGTTTRSVSHARKQLPMKPPSRTALTKVTGTKGNNAANAHKQTIQPRKDQNPPVSICPTQNRYESIQKSYFRFRFRRVQPEMEWTSTYSWVILWGPIMIMAIFIDALQRLRLNGKRTAMHYWKNTEDHHKFWIPQPGHQLRGISSTH